MVSSSLVNFYNRYHQKNEKYSSLIRKGNCTYWYILQLLHNPILSSAIKGSVLDVGTGVGTLALYLSQYAHSVAAIDVSDRAVSIARHAQRCLDIKNVDFKKTELKNKIGHFDLVICSEVIEHVADDAQLLMLMRSNTRKGGYLVLTSPSRANVLFRLGFYARFDREVGHLRRYTEQELSTLVSDAGYSVVLVRSVEGPLRNILFTSRLGIILKLIKGPIVPAFHWLDQLSAWLLGASDIQIIAQAV